MGKVLFAAGIALVILASRPDAGLAAGVTITTLSVLAGDSSLALDGAGNPVVAYRDGADGRLRILHCNDPFCSGGGESLTSPDTEFGQYPSLRLDGAGNPVVSYYTTYFDKLKLLHCNDPNCSGVESITRPDPGAFLMNDPTSLALDASGNPVIAYAPPFEIRVMHCNDANCAGLNESITTHDTMAAAPSLVLDTAGRPVVAYSKANGSDFSTGSLKVMHCNDADCTGDNEAVQSPDAPGVTPSLALDASGRPVIAYYTGSATRDLRVMHCNDANCSGGNQSIVTADAAGDVGVQPSLVLAGSNPLAVYRDATNGDLDLLRCGEANCTPGNFVITTLDANGSGENSSLRLDGAGNPAVTYDAGNGLRLLRCGDATCAAGVGGVSQLPGADTDASSRAPDASRPSTAPLLAIGAGALALILALLLLFRRLDREERSSTA